MRTTIKAATAGLLALALVVPGTSALAKDGDVIRRGACSGPSTWKLKASPENGRIEVELEVDSNVVGQKWNVRLLKNGVAFFTGQRTTVAPSGSFEVRRLTSDPAGTDTIRGRAANPATGEVCVGTLQFPA
jgi:hypothetical protein